MKKQAVLVFASFIALILTFVLGACSDSTSNTPPASSSKPDAPKTPLVQKTTVADWCKEHTVPESICTRCNEGLVAGFKAKGDWCKEHALPESQCFECHPELKAKFEAMAPKSGG